MKRYYIISLLVLLMVTTLSVAQITVKFQKPASWTSVSLYNWGASEILGGWPGTALTASNGWYSYTFPESYTGGNLIFNNAGAGEQTVDYPITSSTCLQASSVLNAGGKYDVTVVPCVSGGIIVKVQKPASWSSMYLYAYVNGSPVIGGWPGALLTFDANGWGSYTFDASVTALNFILNNGNGLQAADTYITGSGCFTTDGATVTSVTCTTAVETVNQKPLNVYPNPVIDRINFSNPEIICKVSIHSLTGQNMMEVSRPSKNGVDVKSLNSGVYFLSMEYANGLKQTEKIIKQ